MRGRDKKKNGRDEEGEKRFEERKEMGIYSMQAKGRRKMGATEGEAGLFSEKGRND